MLDKLPKDCTTWWLICFSIVEKIQARPGALSGFHWSLKSHTSKSSVRERKTEVVNLFFFVRFQILSFSPYFFRFYIFSISIEEFNFDFKGSWNFTEKSDHIFEWREELNMITFVQGPPMPESHKQIWVSVFSELSCKRNKSSSLSKVKGRLWKVGRPAK